MLLVLLRAVYNSGTILLEPPYYYKRDITDNSSELLGFCFKTYGVLFQNPRSFFQRFTISLAKDTVLDGETVSFAL